MESQWTFGVNVWELSEKLEGFTCTWDSDPIYNRRTQLIGGEHEIGNGFEIWRKLFQEHHGGAEAIQLGGMRRLQEWPKCSSQGNIVQHLVSWVECLETYNKELLAAPNVLRSMIMSIIPSEYEDEILVRPEIRTYLDIIEFCKRRATYKRQKHLAELARRPPANLRITALDGRDNNERSDDEDTPPSWAMKLIAAQSQPPAAHPAKRPPKGPTSSQPTGREMPGDEIAALARKPAPNGRRAFNLKCRFEGCWHCGDKGHSRKENAVRDIKGCPKFEAF